MLALPLMQLPLVKLLDGVFRQQYKSNLLGLSCHEKECQELTMEAAEREVKSKNRS
jgi:hypothetical protein